MRAVVHLDLDGADAIFRAHGWSPPATTDELFHTGLEGALELFEEWRVRATLFVISADLAEPAKLSIVREAVRRGHEVGSHTATHRRLTEVPASERHREIVDSRAAIADRLGARVDGFRAPGFALDSRCLDLVSEAGYRYDSSLFESSRLGGSVVGRGGPVRLEAHHGLLEVPLPRFRPLPFPYHPSYSLVLGSWYFRRGLAGRGAAPTVPFTMLFHLTDFSDPLPAEWSGGWRRRLFTLSYLTAPTKRRRCAEMLRLVGDRYDFCSTSELIGEPVR